MIAALSGLTIGSLTLTPSFDPKVTEYAATTENATNTITATAEDGVNISITVNGNAHTNGQPATWSDGANTVNILASAEGKTSTLYEVTVTKQGAKARLNGIGIVGVTLSPTFDPNVTGYTSTTSTYVAGYNAEVGADTPDGVTADIMVNGAAFVKGETRWIPSGDNTVTITASGDGLEPTVYTVTINFKRYAEIDSVSFGNDYVITRQNGITPAVNGQYAATAETALGTSSTPIKVGMRSSAELADSGNTLNGSAISLTAEESGGSYAYSADLTFVSGTNTLVLVTKAEADMGGMPADSATYTITINNT